MYCTRTVQEMDKVVEELRRVQAFREKLILEDVKLLQQRQHSAEAGGEQAPAVERKAEEEKSGSSAPAPLSVRDPRILGICLSSRRNLCIHPEVSAFDNRNKVGRQRRRSGHAARAGCLSDARCPAALPPSAVRRWTLCAAT